MAGNPFTNAQAPMAMQMLAPDIASQQAQLARQQQMADMLREQSMQDNSGTDVVSGWAVRKSPWAGALNVGKALASSLMQQKADDKQLALAKAMQERMGAAFDGMAGGKTSSAPVAPPAQQINPMQATEGAPPVVAAPAQAPQVSQIDHIRNQAKAAYMMGNTELANKLLENISTMTNEQRNMAAMGQNPLEMGRLGTAAARKAGIIELQPGTTALDLSNGQERFQPKVGEGISLNNGQASAIPGYAGANAEIAGAVSSAQEGGKLLPLGYVGPDGRPIGGTTGEYLNGGQPPKSMVPGSGPVQAAPVPTGGAPAAPLNLNHMTPQQSTQLMAQAEKQFGLRHGAAPGRPALQSKAEADQQAADVRLRTEPQLAQKTAEYKDMADYGKTLDGHVSESQALLQRVAESREALTKFKAGGGAETRAKLASMAQAFGMPDDLTNKIAGGDLAAAQVFQKFAAQEALGTMQQALASDSGKGAQGNRISMDLFIKNNPNIGTDPNAIEKVFNFITKQAQQSKAQQEAYQAYKSDPKNDPSTFPAYWAGEAIKRGYVTPQMSTGKALGTVPAGWKVEVH